MKSRGCSMAPTLPRRPTTDVLRARPRHHRAQPRRPAPAAGPGALGRQALLLKELAGMTAAGKTGKARPVAAGLQSSGGTATGLAIAEPAVEATAAVAADDPAAAGLQHGAVVIAAITSCTNTSNPSVMIGGRPARASGRSRRGCARKSWVKTSLAPGSKCGHRVLPPRQGSPSTSTSSASTWSATAAPPASATAALLLAVRSRQDDRGARPPVGRRRALSGNRNFEGRINLGRAGQATSPRRRWSSPTPWPGGIDIDLPERADRARVGRPAASTCATSGRAARRSRRSTIQSRPRRRMFREQYGDVFAGDGSLATASTSPTRGTPTPGTRSPTYVRSSRPTSSTCRPNRCRSRTCAIARVLSLFGDSDHHSTTSRRPARSRRSQPGGKVPDRSTASSPRTSTPTAPGAATTR